MSRFNFSIPNRVKIKMPTDENGMTGRECPRKTCLGYFKIQFGTGLKGKNVPCYCPYCGHKASQGQFWTPDQLKYARSVGIRKVADSIAQGLRGLDFSSGVRMSFVPASPLPIRYYREKELETDMVCSNCTLHYAIYGVFAYCPDCGNHNSLQILRKNLELAGKELELSGRIEDQALKDHLIGDALENVVSAFDGFGRHACHIAKAASTQPNAAERLSFQNILEADKIVQRRFTVQLSAFLSAERWQLIVRCFEKRHLLAHKMGVIDEKYVKVAGDKSARVGRKVQIAVDEVQSLIAAAGDLGEHLALALGLNPTLVSGSPSIA